MFCAKCGNPNNNDARFCRNCSAPLRMIPAPAFVAAKSPGLAAVLSFFICGLGQIYNGQIFKGLLMIIAYFISICLIFVVIGLFTTPILWIWGMMDAYHKAEQFNATAIGNMS
jgi:TM2 domain-containing membrane protein YozV